MSAGTPPVAVGRRRICHESDLAPGELRAFGLDARRSVLVCRSAGGEFYAVSPKCPHQGADLENGTVGGAVKAQDVERYRYDESCVTVRCPWHGWEYDAASGDALSADNPTHIAAFRVTVEDGEVYVDEKPIARARDPKES